jgi:hypothetical protein
MDIINFLFRLFYISKPERMSQCGGGSGPLCTCFNEVKGIQSMYYGQYQELAQSWELFRRVELYNSNVSTMRGSGAGSAPYWQFGNSEELTSYRQGAFLFASYLNYSTIVQKN